MRKIHRKTPVSETLFAKDSNLTQICKTQICKPKAVKKEAPAQVFSCEFSEISKNIFFTEHLRTTASAFSFSEAATRSALWKRCSEKSRKIYRKTLVVCEIFKGTFFTQHLCNCNFTKMGHCQKCSENLRWILFI